MPSLSDILTPATTAVVRVEMQRGVIGDRVGENELKSAVERKGVIPSAEDYADLAVRHTLALITNPTTVDDVVAVWK